ncbi:MAG: hypothetical protein H6686_10875 [Fibrobacteria bacterium]|nr:hypothetical protein [Fibrobacteria bacterium]
MARWQGRGSARSLQAQGLSDEPVRASLRTLDGRLLREVRLSPRSGRIAIDLGALPGGPLVVQLEQGGHSWRTLTTLF